MISEVKVTLTPELCAAGVESFSAGLHNETPNGDWVDWATVNGMQLEGQEARTAVAILLSYPDGHGRR
jgi:hypothetical protein